MRVSTMQKPKDPPIYNDRSKRGPLDRELCALEMAVVLVCSQSSSSLSKIDVLEVKDGSWMADWGSFVFIDGLIIAWKLPQERTSLTTA